MYFFIVEVKENFESNVYKMQTQNKLSTINLEENLNTQEVRIIGLYDPEDYDLDINMWSNSDGDQLKRLIAKLNKMNLSQDAVEIINVSLCFHEKQAGIVLNPITSQTGQILLPPPEIPCKS